MIKLSKLTDYAVVVLSAMAGQQGALVSASVLSARTALPEPTVSKVLKLLVKGGLIGSARGITGGYVLTTSPKDLRVSDIITAIEGPVALTSCVSDSDETCAIEAKCMLRGRWNVVNTAVRAALDSVTLADMIPQGCRGCAKTEEEARL